MKFQVILADPPWRYNYSKSKSRKIENNYPTMSIDDICKLNIGSIVDEDCILFLWTTAPKLEEAFKVINSWGFKYKTGMIWNKKKMGLGYYSRIQHEHILIATKGKIKPPEPAVRPRSIIEKWWTKKHSEKPIEMYEIIEKMYPDKNKIELFSRAARSGWSNWGNEISTNIIL